MRGWIFGTVLVLGLAGCGKEPGSAQTTTPLDASVKSVDTVRVTASASEPANAAHTDRLAHAIKASLEAKGTFANVVVGEEVPASGMTLQVTLVALDTGSDAARAMNLGGEAEMKVSCELVEIGTDKPLGAFAATGNSSRKTQTSINGVNTGIADDLTGRAIMATADQVAQYLAANR